MTEETRKLIELAQSGDDAATERIVSENTGLIRSAVKRFYGRGEADDLFQIGAMGLIKAVKRFDLGFDVEFSTYAVPMIIGEIRRFLRDDGIIKVSRSAKECAAKIRRIRNEEGDIGLREIAERISVSYEDAVYALEATTPPESIDKKVYDGESGVCLGDRIASCDSEDERVTLIALKREIASLPERDRKIIALRYYKELTQSKTAKILGISQVQVSRLEKKIIDSLREKMQTTEGRITVAKGGGM
jgi:RNA polymerase sporulation-specific sigma factor